MRLKKVKLAGFKSFVDPTAINFNANIAAIVGPNGCGKSNIIDAVRWVMGESSAKQLRGGSMSDVIFNGSEKRRPIGQAAIELYFDNSDATFGGEYAKYNEIVIRREVARDGFSDYYLNNTKCRRKDIVDIFLGTGLGPQSYAIIGQGTISQFIEAKPDELRMYLEEAAGVSKYKERRRETEHRIEHTRENLSRLNDLIDEVATQIKHLKSQANAAERYKKLKQDERLTKAQLHVLHWQDLSEQLAELESVIKKEELKLEQKIAEQHVCDAQLAEHKEQHITCNDAFNAIQSRYYKFGVNITRLEQQIHYNKERHKQLEAELAQVDKNQKETITLAETDQNQIKMLEQDYQQLVAQLDNFKNNVVLAEQELQTQESNMQNWQAGWDEYNAKASKMTQIIEVAQTEITHLEQNITSKQQYLQKLRTELVAIDLVDLNTEIDVLQTKQQTTKQQSETVHKNLIIKRQQINQQRAINDNLNAELNVLRGDLQSLKGKLASHQTLQQAALGKNKNEIVEWLQHQGFAKNQRLLQKVKVIAKGWEKAVETVFAAYFEAICVDNLESVFALLHDLPNGQLMFFEGKKAAVPVPSARSGSGAVTLASKITSDLPIVKQLADIYVVDSLSEALQLCGSLASHESVITKDGIWLGKSWLRVGIGSEREFGMLQREQELRDLHVKIAAQQELLTVKEQELQEQQTKLSDFEQQHYELQKAWQESSADFAKIHGEINAKHENISYLQERTETLKQETASCEATLTKQQQQLIVAKEIFRNTTQEQETHTMKSATLSLKRDSLQQALTKIRDLATAKHKEFDSAQMRLELLQKQIGYLQQSLERSQKQLTDLKTKRSKILNLLEEIIKPLPEIEESLKQQLAQRLQVENELQIAKQQVLEIEELLREREQKRSILQEESETIRTALEKLRVEKRELQIRASHHEEQTNELEYNLQALIPEMPEVATIEEWEIKLERVIRRIERLGPINLAAIHEFEEQQQRKEYLDTQNQDLVTALETLENAMRKIDHESKQRFQETFTQVNQNFQYLFTKIFNGGKAQLELVGDNLLNTGVIILAQPQGKRNTSIHLLSGGEKALTAIALIFAIFQLNPAPFCLLDEVDAPLDDTNIMRFCNLIKEMAATIQLIFISHNKLTLEIAGQLTGVTMQEAGVSRIVSVDIDAALAMAEQRTEDG